MSLLTAFTNQLTNLMTELHELYPKDTDIETKRTAIEFIKKTNPRLQMVKYSHTLNFPCLIKRSFWIPLLNGAL